MTSRDKLKRCTRLAFLSMKRNIVMLSPTDSRIFRSMPGASRSARPLQSCMPNGRASSGAAAPSEYFPAGPGHADTLIAKNLVEAVNDSAGALRGVCVRVAAAKNRLYPRGLRCFDFLHRIGDEQKFAGRVSERRSDFFVAFTFCLDSDSRIEELRDVR